MFALDEDEDDLVGLYEGGHWEWDKNLKELIFVSNLPASDAYSALLPSLILGPIEFKDDMDLLEQQKFKRRIQRKTNDNDIVTLQDVKDVVLYTAPQNILTLAVVNILHSSMTERFLRALILYMQCYLQIINTMSLRTAEREVKIRTPNGDKIEKVFSDNLEDLRVLVAKEYCIMLLGGEEYSKYHHMGPSKKSRSLTGKDAMLFETIIRISIQIVWLSLGRKCFNQIELEVHRLFKSNSFNVAEHKLNIKYYANMTPEDRFVLLGRCVHYYRRNFIQSPLLNEIKCNRVIDFKTLGLGAMKFKNLDDRLSFMENMLVADEELLFKKGLSLGIIGLPRKNFDTMLREIIETATTGSSMVSTTGRSASVRSRSASKSSRGSLKKNPNQLVMKLYPDIILPAKNKFGGENMPKSFPEECLPLKPCSHSQKIKWLTRVRQITAGRGNMRKSRLRSHQ